MQLATATRMRAELINERELPMKNARHMFARRGHRWLAVVAASLLLISVVPCFANGEHVVLDARLRAELSLRGHTFAELPTGVVHFELAGPTAGPLVVLIHGVSGPMEVWNRTVGPLHQAGFRTLRFDHFGRGYSERVEGPYDLDLFVRTVEQLLVHLDQEQPVHLVGSSMGALVATEFALRHPGQAASVALIGPAGFPLEVTALAELRKVPGLGEYAMAVFGDAKILEHNRAYFHDHRPFVWMLQRVEEQLEVRGSKSAILSTLRHTPVQSYLEGYRDLGALDVPVWIAWGEEDQTFPISNAPSARDAMPTAAFNRIPSAAHLPMLERADLLVPRLIRHLRGG